MAVSVLSPSFVRSAVVSGDPYGVTIVFSLSVRAYTGPKIPSRYGFVFFYFARRSVSSVISPGWMFGSISDGRDHQK